MTQILSSGIGVPMVIPPGPPPTTKKANGKGSLPPIEAATQSGVDEALKRLREMELLGAEIAEKKEEVAAQETKVAEAKSELESQRGTLNKLEKEKDELQDDLDKLATGGFSDRLPFPREGKAPAAESGPDAKPKAKADASEASEQAVFDKATLAEIGVAGALAEKLAADGVRTGKDLQAFLQSHPPRKIAGVGEGNRDKLQELCAGWYERRAKERKAAAKAAAPKVLKPKDVGAKPGAIEAACSPHLLVTGTDGPPTAKRVIVHAGRAYVVTPPPAGMGDDVYALRVLVPEYADLPDPPQDGDAYHGLLVKEGRGDLSEVLKVGPRSEMLLVRDGGSPSRRRG